MIPAKLMTVPLVPTDDSVTAQIELSDPAPGLKLRLVNGGAPPPVANGIITRDTVTTASPATAGPRLAEFNTGNDTSRAPI